MPPAINHLVALPWTLFSLGRYDRFPGAGKVYLHWSHSADLRLSIISCEFNHIYSDGFHTINVKLFQTLQILKLSLLFLQRTNGIAVFFIRVTDRSSSLLFCSEEGMLNLRETQVGVLKSSNLSSSLLWREGTNQISFNLSLRPTAGPCCALNWPYYLKTENANRKEQ